MAEPGKDLDALCHVFSWDRRLDGLTTLLEMTLTCSTPLAMLIREFLGDPGASGACCRLGIMSQLAATDCRAEIGVGGDAAVVGALLTLSRAGLKSLAVPVGRRLWHVTLTAAKSSDRLGSKPGLFGPGLLAYAVDLRVEAQRRPSAAAAFFRALRQRNGSSWRGHYATPVVSARALGTELDWMNGSGRCFVCCRAGDRRVRGIRRRRCGVGGGRQGKAARRHRGR